MLSVIFQLFSWGDGGYGGLGQIDYSPTSNPIPQHFGLGQGEWNGQKLNSDVRIPFKMDSLVDTLVTISIDTHTAGPTHMLLCTHYCTFERLSFPDVLFSILYIYYNHASARG